MTEPLKAVFLSYASQDAEAARRICDSLRAAGIEVWFDQSELRGGDAWDQKIRQQIKDCALFVPIISAHTTARPEGYFRLEWTVADQRTQMIARNKAFIVPVCVDATPEGTADLPDSFHRVQWTRLPGGATPPSFCDRLASLVGAKVPAQASPTPAIAAPAVMTPAPQTRGRWIVLAAAGVLVMGVIALRPWQRMALRPDSSSALQPASQPGTTSAPERSIAVLPFTDMSEKKDQEYFSDAVQHVRTRANLSTVASCRCTHFRRVNGSRRSNQDVRIGAHGARSLGIRAQEDGPLRLCEGRNNAAGSRNRTVRELAHRPCI